MLLQDKLQHIIMWLQIQCMVFGTCYPQLLLLLQPLSKWLHKHAQGKPKHATVQYPVIAAPHQK